MANFFQIVKQYASGKVGPELFGPRTSTTGGNIVEAATRAKAYLVKALSKTNSMMSIWANADCLINDRSVAVDGTEQFYRTQDGHPEDYDTGFRIMADLENWFSEYGNQTYNHNGVTHWQHFMTLTNGDIICFELRVNDGSNQTKAYKTLYTVRYSFNPDGSLSDPIETREMFGWTQGPVGEEWEPVQPTDYTAINTGLQSILVYLGIQTTGLPTIVDRMNAIHRYYNSFTDLDPGDSIVHNLNVILADMCQSATVDNILDYVNIIGGYVMHYDMSNYVYVKSNTIVTITGHAYNLWDVVKDQLGNVELMGFALSVADSVVADGSMSISNAMASWQSYTASKNESVRNFCNEVVRIAQADGLYAAFTSVLNLFSSQSTAEYDSKNHCMTFTDNSSLVPQAYWQGVFNVIGGVISAAASVIAATGHWIIAAIGFVAGTVMNIIGSIFSNEESKTRGCLHHYGKHLVDCTPFAIGQSYATTRETTAYEAWHSNETYYHEMMNVPGGKIFIGYNKDQNVIYEFHPDLHCRYPSVKNLFHLENVNGIVATFRPMTLNEFYSRIEINDSIVGKKFLNGSDGHFSEDGDDWVMRVASFNCLIFSLWCNLVLRTYSSSDAYRSWDKITYEMPFTGDYNGWNIISVHHPNGIEVVQTVCKSNDSITTSYATAAAVMFCNSIYYAGNYYKIFSDIGADAPLRMLDIEDFASLVVKYSAGNWETYHATPGYMTLGIATRPGMNYVIENSLWYDDVEECPSNVTYCYSTPKYTKSSFWATVVIGAVVSVILVVTTVIATVAAKRAIEKKRLRNSIEIEKAYNNCIENPSDDNINAYRKQVRKANLFSSIFGGTKYSREGYWVATETSDGTSKSIQSVMSIYTSNADPDGAVGSTLLGVDDVVKLIKG